MRWEDQKQINEFGGLNNRKTELRAKVDALKVSRTLASRRAPSTCCSGHRTVSCRACTLMWSQKQLTDLEDAEEIVLMAEDKDGFPGVL